jgi:potassium channel subfamily K
MDPRYISSFVLIGLTACASGPLVLEPKSDHAFSQAFYYAIFAAGLYFIVASLMLVTVYGAYQGHYDREFKLTMSQRTLMLQTISFLVYLLCGATVFSHIEGWAYLDAVYWADFTLLTVGIGDYAPETHLGRSLLFPYAIGGIIILGLVIGSIRSLVLERGKVKMGARMVEKERRRLLKKIESQKKELLEPVTDIGKRPMSRSSSKTLADNVKLDDGLTERKRRAQEFHLMRKIQDDAAKKRRWTSLVVSGTVWFGLWFVGAAIFEQAEYGQNWSYFGSLYFSYTSLLTIGYGDFYPQSNSGKAFFVFWSLLAVPSLTILISNMGDTIVKGIADATIWIGNFTVLPDEKGLKGNLRETVKKITAGRLFNETPPGLLGESNKRSKDSDEDKEGNSRKNDPESAAQRVVGDKVGQETARAEKQGEGNDELPKSKHHYHLILAKEIGKVMKHLKSSPPRKFTFDEWAWYLKLIGEDESSAEMHRKAKKKPRPDGEGLGAVLEEEDGEEVRKKWSWIGNRSPLMGNKEEAEWILKRLTKRLEMGLEKIQREELETIAEDEGGEGRRERFRHEFHPKRSWSGNGETSA